MYSSFIKIKLQLLKHVNLKSKYHDKIKLISYHFIILIMIYNNDFNILILIINWKIFRGSILIFFPHFNSFITLCSNHSRRRFVKLDREYTSFT